jgi:hypothetical protein
MYGSKVAELFGLDERSLKYIKKFEEQYSLEEGKILKMCLDLLRTESLTSGQEEFIQSCLNKAAVLPDIEILRENIESSPAGNNGFGRYVKYLKLIEGIISDKDFMLSESQKEKVEKNLIYVSEKFERLTED